VVAGVRSLEWQKYQKTPWADEGAVPLACCHPSVLPASMYDKSGMLLPRYRNNLQSVRTWTTRITIYSVTPLKLINISNDADIPHCRQGRRGCSCASDSGQEACKSYSSNQPTVANMQPLDRVPFHSSPPQHLLRLHRRHRCRTQSGLRNCFAICFPISTK
jgi:hypothetical protein